MFTFKPDVITFSTGFGDDCFINDGAGNFTGTAMSVSLGGFPGGYADMDGDGIKDFILGSQNIIASDPGQIAIYKGTAGGISNSLLIDKDYSGGNRFVVHDVNNDGRLDIITSSNNIYEDYFGTLINTTVSAGCPGIICQSPSAAICTGQFATITVFSSGSTPRSFQWRKNGIAIAGQTSTSMNFFPVTQADAGTYSCRISNSCGSIVSNDIVLTVFNTPNEPSASNTSGCEGASLTLTASGGTNGQYRCWYVLEEGTDSDGNPITLEILIPGQTNSTYTTDTWWLPSIIALAPHP